MSPEQQRIAIAEACGKTVVTYEGLRDQLYWRENDTVLKLPDYLNDLNAMHEAEKTLAPSSEFSLSTYMFELTKLTIPAGTLRRGLVREYIFHATAAQRAEAFLRANGKWEDDK
jgi:hypothetical protein